MKFINKFKIISLFLILIITNTASIKGQEEKIRLTNGVLWVRSSEEYKLCVKQAYKQAEESLKELAKDQEPGTWCVVMDIDDTIFSTVDYTVHLEAAGQPYSDETWEKWSVETMGTVLPGAVEFSKLVKDLGGLLVIITNTKLPIKEATLEKLDYWGYNYDICLFREGPYSDDRTKVLRNKDILKGTIQYYEEYENVPPLKVIMKVGDSSHDLYDPSVYTYNDVIDKIGKSLIVIPNPLYGSWEDSPDAYIYPESVTGDRPLEFKEGDNFTITLERDKGFNWELSGPLEEDTVQLISSKYENNSAEEKEIWIFKAIKKGKTIISFEYLNSSNENFSEKNREIFIIVK